MTEPKSIQSSGRISLDVYAVVLSLILALLVRFDLIPKVPW